MTWAYVRFKPSHYRLLVQKKGKISHKFCFALGSIQILGKKKNMKN